MKYHLKFRHIKKLTIENIRLIIKSGLFKKDTTLEQKQMLICELSDKLCMVYNLQPVMIKWQDNFFGVGCYNHVDNSITLNKPSLVTFLHEFYHYMAIKNELVNTEDNARGWSISAYYLATPKLCTKAIEKGLIIHQKSITEE